MKYGDHFEKLKNQNDENRCKLCDSKELRHVAHTVKCKECGALLNFPYLAPREVDYIAHDVSKEQYAKSQENSLNWHLKSGSRNHNNFTAMACFCEDYISRENQMDILDYGGGGGQFALVFKSLYPKSACAIVDMDDARLLENYAPLNKQIKFSDFEEDTKKFDFIFMNDVFEHLTFPVETLQLLRTKLKPNGKIFIDTPCTFWLYTLTYMFSKRIHTKLLNGTVDYDHQQIWTTKSFYRTCEKAGFSVKKYDRLSEYTQPAAYYLDNMGITSPILRLLGKVFVRVSPLLAKNKIMAVIEPNSCLP